MAEKRPPREDLVRASRDIGLERSSDPAGMPTLTGHFAVFDQWTHIRSAYEGNFMERFAPGAFDKTINENAGSMKVLFEHGKDPQIGNKVLGRPRSLQPDATGVRYDVELFDTSYVRDLIPGLEAGQYGASFRFRVLQEKYDEKPKRSADNPDGIPERTVTEAAVAEFGPVTFPAYPGATAGIRSMTDRFLFEALTEDPEQLRELIESRKHSRAFIASAPRATVTYTTNGVTEEVRVDSEERAVWTTAYVNNLPDSSFLYVESGGTKDSDGKTTPRSLRHFPYKDSSGNVDLPHLRNALARIPQSNLPASVKAAATAKAQRLLSQSNSGDESGEQRMDTEDIGTLAEMLELADHYIEEQDEPEDQPNIPKMQAIVRLITDLIPVEVAEAEPEDEPEDEAASSAPRSQEPPEASTSTPEPVRSVGTTRAKTLYTRNRKDSQRWRL